MRLGVTCRKLVSLNKISPVIEKTHLFINYIIFMENYINQIIDGTRNKCDFLHLLGLKLND